MIVIKIQQRATKQLVKLSCKCLRNKLLSCVIIDSSMHTKRASTLKLETAMNALNLSKGDAKRFIEVRLLQSVTTAHDSILSTTASCANHALCVQDSCCINCTDASVQAITMV